MDCVLRCGGRRPYRSAKRSKTRWIEQVTKASGAISVVKCAGATRANNALYSAAGYTSGISLNVAYTTGPSWLAASNIDT